MQPDELIADLISRTHIQDPGETIRAASEVESRDLDSLPLISEELHLGGELGRGGMGAVLEATQVSLDRRVAVKMLKTDASSTARMRLLEEARITGGLEHPNIVPVHALGKDETGQPLLVMKRVEGVSWAEHLHSDPHREQLDFHINVLIQLCNAVAFAHDRGFLHRDLKPANVMIGEFGEVYLVDWGLALRLDERAPGLQPIVGTPNFLAPEMLLQDHTLLDERTDIYLLGGMLHYVLTGRAPHPGTAVVQVLQHVFSGAPISFDRSLPKGLAAIAQRALRHDPEDRYESATEMRAELSSYLQNRAAEEIAAEAEESLRHLEKLLADPETDETTLYKVFGACRFGFQHAGAVARGAAESRRQKAIRMMVDYELGRQSPEAAAALAAELDPLPEDVSERIAEVRQEVAATQRELHSLRDMKREADVGLGSRARAVVLVLMAAGFTVVGIILMQLAEWLEIYVDFQLGVRLAMVLGVAAAMYFGRYVVAETEANRRLGSTLFVAALGLLATRVVTAMTGIEIDLVLALDLLLLGACGGVAGVALDKRLLPAAVVTAIFGFVIAAFPRHAAGLYAGGLHVALLCVVIAWWIKPTEEAK